MIVCLRCVAFHLMSISVRLVRNQQSWLMDSGLWLNRITSGQGFVTCRIFEGHVFLVRIRDPDSRLPIFVSINRN
jgi:hypothetical protein